MKPFALTNKFVSNALWKNVALKNSGGSIEIYEIDQAEETRELIARIAYDNDDVECRMIGDWTETEKKDWIEFIEKVKGKHTAWKSTKAPVPPVSIGDRIVADFFKRK